MPYRQSLRRAAGALAIALSPLAISPALAQASSAGPAAPHAATTTPTPSSSTPAGKLPSSDKFSTAAAASQHCPGDTVVWTTSSKSRAFHLSGSKYYGKTHHGAFVCEKDALAAGYHASKK